MIATRSEIKQILQITNTDSDALIDMLIPITEQSICDYCNNDFIDCNYEYYTNDNITFDSNDNSINATDVGKYLIAGDSIRVYNSLRNNYSFTAKTVTNDKIIVEDLDTILNETYIYTAPYIVKIAYPRSLKFAFAKMIEYSMTKQNQTYKREKIDDYEYELNLSTTGEFPASLTTSLQKFRKLIKRGVI